MESVSIGAIGEFRKVVDSATTEYNDNHNLKLAKYNANASEKLTTYDVNAEQRTSDYNRRPNSFYGAKRNRNTCVRRIHERCNVVLRAGNTDN